MWKHANADSTIRGCSSEHPTETITEVNIQIRGDRIKRAIKFAAVRISLLLFPTSPIPLAILLIAMSTYAGGSVRTAQRVHMKLCCEPNSTPLFLSCISFGLCCYYWANPVEPLGKFGVFAIAVYPMETQMFDAAKRSPRAETTRVVTSQSRS
jgi:hypothetical protein